MISVVSSIIKFISAISIALIFARCTYGPEARFISIMGKTMGTTYSLKIVDSSNISLSEEALKLKVDSVLVEVNRQMSTYIPTSEISLFNKSESLDWQSVSYDFAYVLDLSKQIGLKTNGASDLTIGPLVNIWGFGPNYIPEVIPTNEEIRSAKLSIGLDKIHAQLNPPMIKKDKATIYCDLSSTAKGFGVDQIAEFIIGIGFNNFLVEIGGEVRVSGNNQYSVPWKVGISTPDASGKLQRAIELKNSSMATSGDYWNYFEKDGVRYSHLIDARTGKPIQHNLASVTVIHEYCMMADGYATAINVMGAEEGLIFADKENLAVFMIVRDGKEFSTIESRRFSEIYN